MAGAARPKVSAVVYLLVNVFVHLAPPHTRCTLAPTSRWPISYREYRYLSYLLETGPQAQCDPFLTEISTRHFTYTFKMSTSTNPHQRLRIGQAYLEYQSAANDTWELLPTTTFNPKYNVFGIDVKLGSIKITQKFGAGTGTCIATLTPAHYKSPKLDMDTEQEKQEVDFLLEFERIFEGPQEAEQRLAQSHHDRDFFRDKINFEAWADSHTLSDFPLYHSLPGFRAVRLRLPQAFFRPHPKPDQFRTSLMHLLSGNVSPSPAISSAAPRPLSTPLPPHLRPPASFSLASRPSLQPSTP